MKHTLDIKAVNRCKHKPNTEDREFKELDFGKTPQKLLPHICPCRTYMREFNQK